MILDFDQVGELLDQMAEEVPPEFYEELNGGISLLPEAREDPEGDSGELYIMGEYCNDMMGRYINLYYGSFAALAEQEDWTEEDWEDELYTTLAHELTHHVEGRAGAHGLEIKDEQFMEAFRAEHVHQDGDRIFCLFLIIALHRTAPPGCAGRPESRPGRSRPAPAAGRSDH